MSKENKVIEEKNICDEGNKIKMCNYSIISIK